MLVFVFELRTFSFSIHSGGFTWKGISELVPLWNGMSLCLSMNINSRSGDKRPNDAVFRHSRRGIRDQGGDGRVGGRGRD